MDAALFGVVVAACSQEAEAPEGLTSPLADHPACSSLMPASVGGPLPDHPRLLVVRWLGTTNYELAHRGQVLLLDAFFERGPGHPSLGFTRDEVERADAVLVGHGHWDHISDAPFVAERTGATVVGGPPSIDYVRGEGVPEDQTELVRGGEVLSFDGFTVEAVRAHHASFPSERYQRSEEAYELVAGGEDWTDAERARAEEIRARGSSDPAIAAQGTIAYLFTFDGGFTAVWTDTPGPITEEEREAVRRVGSVDAALLAYQGPLPSWDLTEWVMRKVRLYRPSILLPTHHDRLHPVVPDAALFPFFTAVRDELPDTRTVAPLYRTPICIDLETGRVEVGGG